MNGKAPSSPILGYSFLASVLINLGWVAWVAHSSIFSSAVTLTALHERPIRIFKPVPVKPPPKPKVVRPLPPPPPPKEPKAQPEIKPLRPVLHLRPIAYRQPPPHQQEVQHTPAAAPAPPRPAPVFEAMTMSATPRAAHTVSPSRPIAVALSPRSTSSILRTPAPENTGPVQPTAPRLPSQPASAPRLPSQPASAPAARQPEAMVRQPEPEAKRPEPVTKQPEPAPVVRHVEEVRAQPEAEPPRPKPVEHPRGWVPIDAREATLEGDIEVPTLPDGVDLGQLENTTVIISYEVDEFGHPTNIKVRKRSGNSELDERCKEAVRRAHYLPAVQDHIPYAARTSFSFNFTS